MIGSLKKIRQILNNKVMAYTFMRYMVCFISFVASMIIAVKLGPFYLGIWGFLLLLRRYFQLINLGIPDSVTILLVQNKNDKIRAADYETTAIVLIGILSVFVIFFAVYYYFFGIPAFEKYEVGNWFYYVCVIAILTYFNDLFFKIYRVKNRIFEISFYQSVVQVLTIGVVFFFRDRALIHFLLWAYVFGYALSGFLFLRGKKLIFTGRVSFKDSHTLLSKGFFLFLYNFSFYMIVLSTRTIIGAYYSVEEFGYFTFAYTLSNAILILLDAFASLLIPKLIDKFNSGDMRTIESTIRTLRVNYVYSSHLLMYVLLMSFPVLLYFFPQYSDTLPVINLISLATVLFTNSFGYSLFLMARNREKVIAVNSLLALALNVGIGIFVVTVLKWSYEYVIVATLISYLLYTYLSVYFGQKEVGLRPTILVVLKECFPLKLLLPFLLTVAITVYNWTTFLFLPFLVFVVLNLGTIKELYSSLKRLLVNPNLIDVK